MTSSRQPTFFLPHGGGPCFWMESPPPFGPHAWDKLREFLAGVVESLPAPPKAFVVVTAHWETDEPTVSVAAAPGMIYDYYGFPKHTYELKYPAPGAPELGARAKNLIAGAGLPVETDGERGFDHGVFVPFLIVDPEARIPVVMISLQRDLDPGLHIAVGKALAPLRDEGVVIVGSGMSYHDLRHFRDGDGRASERFDAWLGKAVTTPDPKAREDSLTHWAEAPFARECHPREEHLLPLMVAAGAAADSRGVTAFHDVIGGKTISGFRFG
jgi:aromatic ring-opening dioxygenase catalytic subunit (LigB family)